MMNSASDAQTAATHVRRLSNLTEALSERLEAETLAFVAHRPQDIVEGLGRTQDMANLYRRESAQLKAQPGLAAAAPAADRQALIRATERFEDVLAKHAAAVTAARTVSEGVVQAIAAEVTASRATGSGYGALGRATSADGTAITLNRSA